MQRRANVGTKIKQTLDKIDTYETGAASNQDICIFKHNLILEYLK